MPASRRCAPPRATTASTPPATPSALRHGRTPGNIGRVYQHPDIPLATEGFADADIAAKCCPSTPST